jgi:hypothetical protein
MAIKKIDPNLLAPLNESNLDGTYNISEPKQIYVDASFYTSQNLSYFDKKIGLKTERCKIVKVITTGADSAGPQVGSYSWTRRNSQGLSNTNMKIFQAIVIPTNASNQSVPLLTNASNLDEEPLDKIRLKFHTKAFLEYDSTKSSTLPRRYDEVLIEYVGNDTEEARIIEVYSKNNVGVPISPPTNPQTAFNNSDGTTLGNTKIQKTTGPNKDDPSFATCKASTYPNLQKKSTTFPKYTEQQVIDAIKQATSDPIIRKMCFSIISIEQPNYSFPNNNVAGIQLDGGRFPNTTESDFDYQTCFRDGGGDQRIFAGFNTLQKGMLVFSKIIQGKVNGGSFKTLTGDLENQSSIMADNYYRSWNLRATEDEITQLKTKGFFVRDGKQIKRNYNSTKLRFKNKLSLIE